MLPLIAAGMASAMVNNISAQQNNDYQNAQWYDRQNYLDALQKGIEKRQFDYNKKLMDYSFQKNLEQWNKENKYNSPLEQMKRFAAAGLNANLVYNNQSLAGSSPEMSTSSVSSSLPVASDANYSKYGINVDPVSAAHLANETKLADANASKLDAETLKIMLDADITKETKDAIVKRAFADLYGVELDNISKDFDNSLKIELKSTTIEQAKQDLAKTKAETNETLAKIQAMDFDNQYKDMLTQVAKYERDIKKVDASKWDDLRELEKKKEAATIAFLNKQTALLKRKLGSYSAELNSKLMLQSAETLNRTEFAELADSRTTYQDFQNKLNEILLDPTKKTDASVYFKALLLKNLNETSFMDVIKEVRNWIDDFSDKNEVPQNSDNGKNEVPQNNDKIPERMQGTYDNLPSDKKKRFDDWLNEHPDASEQQIVDNLVYLLHTN